jgi:ATP-dependent RNA helicase DDX46/PRP5
VKDLVLVINYTVPNHYEDYVHRVGRTGRAGKKGTAITFVTPEEERFAPELVAGLELSKATVPQDLKRMADEYGEKRKRGEVQWGGNDGFAAGRGFKFDDSEDLDSKQSKLALRAGDDPENEQAMAAAEATKLRELEKKDKAAAAKVAAGGSPSSSSSSAEGDDVISQQLSRAKAAAKAAAQAANVSSYQAAGAAHAGGDAGAAQQGAAAAKAYAMALSIKAELTKDSKLGGMMGLSGGVVNPDYHFTEVEINDYPQHARYKGTHKKTLDVVQDNYDVCITTKGIWLPPGRSSQSGERKLYLLIEGKTDVAVKMSRKDVVRILEEAAADAKPEKDMYGKYSVMV